VEFLCLDIGLGFATGLPSGEFLEEATCFYALDIGLGFATDAVPCHL
jgi:hypothetical protein